MIGAAERTILNLEDERPCKPWPVLIRTSIHAHGVLRSSIKATTRSLLGCCSHWSHGHLDSTPSQASIRLDGRDCPSTGPTADGIVLGSSCADRVSCWAVGVTIDNINSNAHFRHSWSTGTALVVACRDSSDSFRRRWGPLQYHLSQWVRLLGCGSGVGVAGDGSPSGSLTEHWDGTAWSIVPSPTPTGDFGALLQGVSCFDIQCSVLHLELTRIGETEQVAETGMARRGPWCLSPATVTL